MVLLALLACHGTSGPEPTKDTRIDHAGTDDASDGTAMSLGPRIAADGQDVYVTWFDGRDGAYDIYVQASHDGGATWMEAPVRVDEDTPGSAYSASPRLAVDGQRVAIVWEDS